MGNWERQQIEKSEQKERDRVRRELSKLSFAGLVISIILPLLSDVENIIMWMVAFFGLVLTASSALLANKILK